MKLDVSQIANYNSWEIIEEIKHGWSKDTKYYIKDRMGHQFLLRISSIEEKKNKEKIYRIIQSINELDFEMSKAIDYGMCNDFKNVYMLFSWVEGEPLENVIASIDEQKQFILGVKAGQILKKIHSVNVKQIDIPKEDLAKKKLKKLKRYEDSRYRIPNDKRIIDYVKSNIQLINQSNPVYTHGDFHIGNFIYLNKEDLGIIDFDRLNCGDRYEEFYKLQSFVIEKSIPFAIGQIKGYFEENPPEIFWEVQKVYVAHASLYSIEWASSYGQDDINGMIERYKMAMKDYDDFKLLIPKWYTLNEEKFHIQR